MVSFRQRPVPDLPATDGIDRQLLRAVAADLDALVGTLSAPDAVADRLARAVAALRAWDASTDNSPAQRLLGLASMHAEMFRLHGYTTDGCLGPVPAELDHDRAGLLGRALSVIADNVRTHARATSVVIVLVTSDEFIGLTIGDDGCGFDLDDLATDGMLQRSLSVLHGQLTAVGGTLSIASEPGRGARLEVRLPRGTSALGTPRSLS